MASFNFSGHKVIVKYLYENHGAPYFQMRVPQDLQHRFDGRKKISIPLREEDGSPMVQVQRLAKQLKARFKALRFDPSLTSAEAKDAASALLRTHGLAPGDGLKVADLAVVSLSVNDQPHIDSFFDELVEATRDRELTPDELLAVKALRGRLPVTLSEILQVYFENHPKGSDKRYIKLVTSYWLKLVAYLGDMAVDQVRREHTRKFVRLRSEQKVKRSTIQKEINVLRAVFTKGIRELELKVVNPFQGLEIPHYDGGQSVRRVGFSVDEHRKIVIEALAKSDDVRMIVLVCAFTGCRLGEVVGLRVKDLELTDPCPFLRVEAYGNRSLKTNNSERCVPVLPILRTALETYLRGLDDGEVALFGRYNNLTDPPFANTASATVNKWIKSVGIAKSSHCFRHSVISMLRESGVSRDLWEEITGHKSQRISDSYGFKVSNQKKFEALELALSPLVSGLIKQGIGST